MSGNVGIVGILVLFLYLGYLVLIAGFIFVVGYIILWLLQHFHVIGGCVC